MVLQIDSGSDHPAQVRGIKGVLGSNKLSSLQFCGGGRGQYRGWAEVGLICQKRDDLGIINIAITVEWTHKYWLQIHSASPPNPPPANPPAASQLCQGQEPSPANTLNFLLFPYRICNRECISFIFFDWSNSDYVFSMGFERSIENVKGKGWWSVNYELSSWRKYLKLLKTHPLECSTTILPLVLWRSPNKLVPRYKFSEQLVILMVGWPVRWPAGELNTGRGRVIGTIQWSPGSSFLLIVLPRSDKIETELFYWGKLPTLPTHNRYLVAHCGTLAPVSALDVWEIEFLAVISNQWGYHGLYDGVLWS